MTTITVNGKQINWTGSRIGYGDVIHLAFGAVVGGATPAVSYQTPGGSPTPLKSGDQIDIVDDTEFTVTQ